MITEKSPDASLSAISEDSRDPIERAAVWIEHVAIRMIEKLSCNRLLRPAVIAYVSI